MQRTVEGSRLQAGIAVGRLYRPKCSRNVYEQGSELPLSATLSVATPILSRSDGSSAGQPTSADRQFAWCERGGGRPMDEYLCAGSLLAAIPLTAATGASAADAPCLGEHVHLVHAPRDGFASASALGRFGHLSKSCTTPVMFCAPNPFSMADLKTCRAAASVGARASAPAAPTI